MKKYVGFKKTTVFILVVSLLLGPVSALIVEASTNTYTLKDSLVMNDQGEWVNDGSNFSRNPRSYNCYAYAIGRVEGNRFYNEGQNELLYQPGDIFWDYKNTSIYDTEDIKNKVRQDLEITGHTNILFYDNFDSVPTIGEAQELICFRIGETSYHFMKYDTNTEAWYHKPRNFAILKYTNNQGIPSNDKDWSDERIDSSGIAYAPTIIFNGPIVFITYTKPQLNVQLDEELQQNLNIKGKRYVCCDCNYICNCNMQQLSGGMDALYEIVVSESGDYTIQLTTDYDNHDFNYEIYSYNMYNGDYAILKSGSGNSSTGVTETVNLKTRDYYNDNTEGWEYKVNKYYLRLDFGRANTSDQSVNVSITHTHEYTYSYSPTKMGHNAYCWCGAKVLQPHQIADGVCILCNENHEHSYIYRWMTYTTHRSSCMCGEGSIESHVIESDAIYDSDGYTTCLFCDGKVSNVGIILSINNRPHTENGSYIRLDGIIILVDEDIEAYFDGTLEFHYPDDNLETE